MRFVKFAVVGVANTAISFAVFNLAAVMLHMAPLWAERGGVAGRLRQLVLLEPPLDFRRPQLRSGRRCDAAVRRCTPTCWPSR